MIFTPTPENPENTPDNLKAALTAAIAKVVRENYPTDKGVGLYFFVGFREKAIWYF